MSVQSFNSVLSSVPAYAGNLTDEQIDLFMRHMVPHLYELAKGNPHYPFVSPQILTAWDSYKEYVLGNRQVFQLNGVGLPEEIAILAFFFEMVKFPRYGNVPVDSIRTMGIYHYYQDSVLRSLVEGAALDFTIEEQV